MSLISRRTVLAAGSAAAGGLLLAGCDRVPSTIKIGVAQPLSGPLAALGQDMLDGARLAVNELNAAKFAVRSDTITFEIVSADDKADAAEGKKVAQQLVDAGVVAVIGHLNSGVSIEAAPVYAAKGVIQLAISTHPRYTELGLPTTFRLVANDNLQARALGSYAADQLGGTRIAVVDDGTPYGKNLADTAAGEITKAKRTVALRKGYDDKRTDFAELAAELKAGNIKTVVAVLNDFQVLGLLQNLKAVGHTEVDVLGADTIKTTDMLKGVGVVRSLHATSPVLDATEFPSGGKFLESYRAAYKREPAYAGHYSYDAVYAVAGALRRGESVDVAKLRDTLRRADIYTPVTGGLKFDDKGDQRYGAISVYAVRGGRWESKMRSSIW